MNNLPQLIEKGAYGEILVQLRFLEYGVQPAPPNKDTGNDLIAVRQESFRAIQVKTTTVEFPIKFTKADLPELYHILAIVVLRDFQVFTTSNFRVPLFFTRSGVTRCPTFGNCGSAASPVSLGASSAYRPSSRRWLPETS